jgi:hypothetical protein
MNHAEWVASELAEYKKRLALRDLCKRQLADAERDLTISADALFARDQEWTGA